MYRLISAVMLAGLGGVVLPFAQTQSRNTEVQTEIASLTRQLSDGTPKGVLENLFADDYVRVAADGTFLRKPQVLGALGESGSQVRYGSPRIFVFGNDLAVTAALGSGAGNRDPDAWITARVFQKRDGKWRVIAEDVRAAAPPVAEAGMLPKVQPAAPVAGRANDVEGEVRRAIEAWRVATDPESQRGFGRVQDSAAILAGVADDYVRVRRDANLTVETKDRMREQFVEVDRTGKAVSPGHQWANAPNASLRFENVNVAVFGDIAVVTWRTMLNGSDRGPAYSVFRVYRKAGAAWLCVFGI